MSSFNNPHYMYLFELKNGKKRLAYGKSPVDALEILATRLSPIDMEDVIKDKYIKINQRRLLEYVDELG